MKCLKCGMEVPNDSTFCQYCGNEIPKVKRCAYCDAELSDDMRFCAMCGKQVVSAGTPITKKKTEKKRRKWPVFLAIGLIALILIGGILAWVLSDRSATTVPPTGEDPKQSAAQTNGRDPKAALEALKEKYKPSTEEPKVLIAGTSVDFPPYEYYDEQGNIVGVEVDALHAIATECGYELVIVDIPFNELASALKDGEVDLIFGGMEYTPERVGEAAATSSFNLSFDCVLYVKKQNASLLNEINQAISALQEDGKLAKNEDQFKGMYPQLYPTDHYACVRTITVPSVIDATEIYNEWVFAGGTEEALIAIMDKHGSSQGGGKLHFVSLGTWVDEVDAWCFNFERQIGDFQIIENPYGYTICYYSDAILKGNYSETTLGQIRLRALQEQYSTGKITQSQYETGIKGLLTMNKAETD